MTGSRILLYGASNLWLSRRAALSSVRRRFEGPLSIGLACGPGRSYGLRAGNPLVRYRPLREVDFPTFDGPTLAVLGDAGNDIAYSQRPDTTANWVLELAERLEQKGADVVLTGLPLESLRSLPAWLFRLLQAIYYNDQKVSQADVMQRLADLEGLLQTASRERGYLFLGNDPSWYGFDRFHLRSASYATCWESWMERLRPNTTTVDSADKSLLSRHALWRLHPQQYWYRGREKRSTGEYFNTLPQTTLWVR